MYLLKKLQSCKDKSKNVWIDKLKLSSIITDDNASASCATAQALARAAANDMDLDGGRPGHKI